MWIHWALLPFRVAASVLLAVPWVLGWITGFPMVALGLLFCRYEDEHMPWPFWLWDSYAGINGTFGGANRNWVQACGGQWQTRTYLNRWIFLAWRNPCGNLGGRLLAAKMPRESVTTLCSTWAVEYHVSGWLWTINLFGGRIRLGWKLRDKGQFLFRFKPSP